MKLLLLLLKGLKFGKLLGTAGTMLLSVVVYAWVFGWWYAVGFVALLFVHEMGHYLAARRRGLAVGAPTFIPFVGAWIQLKDLPHDAETEAYVGMAGPLLGSVGALACFYLARSTGSPLLLALAYSGFFLNLFNLIPLAPFDGGRITAAISPRLWLIGVPLLVALFFYSPSPLLILMALLAAPNVMKAWRGLRTPEEQTYYNVAPEARLSYAVVYLGLAAFLAIMCQQLHAELPQSR
ncbi:MAG TPA: site-2 protease family protein [Candidatus Dormibacteraeota bacterium]|nr:site-2 protease family protein [Candidatus Dormibacteraeota bacterium]